MNKQIVQFGTADGKPDESIDVSEDAPLKDKVIAALRTVYDPEIPLNLYDLGLIYDIEIQQDNKVMIEMTLTTPHCPVAELMPNRVEAAVRKLEEVDDVEVKLVWDPPWNQERMSDEAKLTLGLM
jgi:FeS assembly SUF system protein